MGWERPIITDSGGFQVFSLAHGNVADEVKGRRGGPPLERAECSRSPSAGCASAPTSTAPSGSSHRSDRWRSRPALGSDIALVFDECTPFHADRDYTARSTERTHRWLDRCLDWHGENGPAGQAVFGIVQGGVHEDLRRESAEAVAAAGVDGLAIGGTLGRDKDEMRGVLDDDVAMLPADAAEAPARDRRARRPARGDRAAASTSSTAPCRPGSAATGWRSRRCRTSASASTSASGPHEREHGPLVEGCPCRPARATAAPTSTTSRAPRS